jgi:hypothetical protein
MIQMKAVVAAIAVPTPMETAARPVPFVAEA